MGKFYIEDSEYGSGTYLGISIINGLFKYYANSGCFQIIYRIIKYFGAYLCKDVEL